MEITGVVEAINNENNNGHDKKELTIAAGKNNTLFVEFQGKTMEKVWDISPNDKVKVNIRFNGKVSKIGRRDNNIVGKSIKKI